MRGRCSIERWWKTAPSSAPVCELGHLPPQGEGCGGPRSSRPTNWRASPVGFCARGLRRDELSRSMFFSPCCPYHLRWLVRWAVRLPVVQQLRAGCQLTGRHVARLPGRSFWGRRFLLFHGRRDLPVKSDGVGGNDYGPTMVLSISLLRQRGGDVNYFMMQFYAFAIDCPMVFIGFG